VKYLDKKLKKTFGVINKTANELLCELNGKLNQKVLKQTSKLGKLLKKQIN